MVVFDATMLLMAIQPGVGGALDPKTGEEITHVAERVAFLIGALDKSKTKIGIPTPALSEILVRAGAGAFKLVEKINEISVFQTLPFDEASAIEVAILTKNALDSGDKKDGSDGTWAKIKYDRQIIAIAKRFRASAIYTDDKSLRNTATRIRLSVIGLSDLELPPERAQIELELHQIVGEPDMQGLDEIDQAAKSEPVSTPA